MRKQRRKIFFTRKKYTKRVFGTPIYSQEITPSNSFAPVERTMPEKNTKKNYFKNTPEARLAREANRLLKLAKKKEQV